MGSLPPGEVRVVYGRGSGESSEIEGFLWLGSIPLRGSVMNKGMEWDKVKSLGDIN